MQILFLYTELAEYTLACFKSLKVHHPNVQLTVVHYPINPEAPFNFDFEGIGIFKSIKEFNDYSSLKNFVEKTQPCLVVSSGWANKWYVKICRIFSSENCVTVLTMDNHWNGSLKQKLLSIISPLTLKKAFQKIWVPGKPQGQYAKRLGFADADIATGFYCCDTEKFRAYFEKYKEDKKRDFPKRFLCVARYVSWKGYEELWDAFIELQNEFPNDWELWCAGTGEEYDKRRIHSKIKHLGFVQKNEWDNIIQQTGVFVLASHEEPWGVAVHEFAVAGYPLILSDKIGAATKFLGDSNGFVFPSGNKEQIKAALKKIVELDNEALNGMATKSQKLAMTHTPVEWAAVLMGFIKCS